MLLRLSSVAQWQSMRLLTAGLLVRVQPEEQKRKGRQAIACRFLMVWGGTSRGLGLECRHYESI